MCQCLPLLHTVHTAIHAVYMESLYKQHAFPGKAGLSSKLTHPVPPLDTPVKCRQITNVNMLHHSCCSWHFQRFFTWRAKSAFVSEYLALHHHCKCQSDRATTDLLGEDGRSKGLGQASSSPLVPAALPPFLQLLSCPLTSTTPTLFGMANTLVLSK